MIKVTLNILNKLFDTEILILDIIKNNKGINKSEIAKMSDKSEMTVQRAIKKLLNEKLIIRVGSRKTGHWGSF